MASRCIDQLAQLREQLDFEAGASDAGPARVDFTVGFWEFPLGKYGYHLVKWLTWGIEPWFNEIQWNLMGFTIWWNDIHNQQFANWKIWLPSGEMTNMGDWTMI